MIPIALLAACTPDGAPVAPPAEESRGRCSGQAVASIDGVPVGLGEEVRDAELRVVEEAHRSLTGDSAWRQWQTWERDDDGIDRIRELRFDADDDGTDVVVLDYDWMLDERLRLVWEITYEGGRVADEHTHAYDDDDHLIESVQWAGDEAVGRGLLTWIDDRLVLSLSYFGDELMARIERQYLEPAPSLDHLEFAETAWYDSVVRVDHDDEGRLLGVWRVEEDGAEVQVQSNTYDERGRVVEEVHRYDLGEVSIHRYTSTWRDDDLLETYVDEVVEGEGRDVVTEWSWSCD